LRRAKILSSILGLAADAMRAEMCAALATIRL
jgi:hypothetical protein